MITITQSLVQLYTELLSLNENKTIIDEYKRAIQLQDSSIIYWFNKFGNTARQQVMNVDAYRHGLIYGFDGLVFNQHGWLDNSQWEVEETINIYDQTRLIIAKGKNTYWTYGMSYSYGMSGGGYRPSVFFKPYKSKKECTTMALKTLINNFQQRLDSAIKNPDPSNYNLQIMKSVINATKKLISEQYQYGLFA